MTLQEEGKAPQKALILKQWQQPDGSTAYEVQNLVTKEIHQINTRPEFMKPAADLHPSVTRKAKRPWHPCRPTTDPSRWDRQPSPCRRRSRKAVSAPFKNPANRR